MVFLMVSVTTTLINFLKSLKNIFLTLVRFNSSLHTVKKKSVKSDNIFIEFFIRLLPSCIFNRHCIYRPVYLIDFVYTDLYIPTCIYRPVYLIDYICRPVYLTDFVYTDFVYTDLYI